jgi:hypothetical protein
VGCVRDHTVSAKPLRSVCDLHNFAKPKTNLGGGPQSPWADYFQDKDILQIILNVEKLKMLQDGSSYSAINKMSIFILILNVHFRSKDL